MRVIIICGPDSICVDGLTLAIKRMSDGALREDIPLLIHDAQMKISFPPCVGKTQIPTIGHSLCELSEAINGFGISAFKASPMVHDFAYAIEEEKPKHLPPWRGNEPWKDKRKR